MSLRVCPWLSLPLILSYRHPPSPFRVPLVTIAVGAVLLLSLLALHQGARCFRLCVCVCVFSVPCDPPSPLPTHTCALSFAQSHFGPLPQLFRVALAAQWHRLHGLPLSRTSVPLLLCSPDSRGTLFIYRHATLPRCSTLVFSFIVVFVVVCFLSRLPSSIAAEVSSR